MQSSATSQNYSGLRGSLWRLKDWTESQAQKPYAMGILFLLAFAESSFFPIPPDVLLIAMCVASPRRALLFAAICTLGSVLGGIAGYGIGYLAWWDVQNGGYGAIAQFFFNYIPGFTEAKFASVQALYEKYDFWVVFTAGFTPIPYKIITIAAGVFKIPFGGFVLASLIGRAGRFFLVSSLFYFFGTPIKTFIDKYFELLSVAFLLLLVAGFALLKYIH